MRKYLLILGIPSIVLLFLPYTSGVSPWATVSGKEWGWMLALLGGPFFLSIPILIAQTRVLLKRPFSRGERTTYRLLAYAALAAWLALPGIGFRTQGFSKEDILWSSIWCIPCAAAVWMMILSARKLNPEEATTVMLQVAWLPNAIYCAIGFFRGWQIGAYLAAFTIVLYAVEITLSMRRKRPIPSPMIARWKTLAHKEESMPFIRSKFGKLMIAPVLLAVLAPIAMAGDWDSLGRLSNTQTVKVYLRNGQEFKGSIQEVGPEGLKLATGRSTRVKFKEIATPVSGMKVGQTVELSLRNGQVLSGTIQSIDNTEPGPGLRLAERSKAVPVKRADVDRVTKRTRGLTAAIGAAAGASVGLLAARPIPVAGATGPFAVYGALFGAGIGALVGHTQTLYRTERPK